MKKKMKSVTGFYYNGNFFVAQMDEAGNLHNIENRAPEIEWEGVKSLPKEVAKQPRNGITLQSAYDVTGDYDHTLVYVLPEGATSKANVLTSDVVVSLIFGSGPERLTKGSDAANDAIFGKDGW